MLLSCQQASHNDPPNPRSASLFLLAAGVILTSVSAMTNYKVAHY